MATPLDVALLVLKYAGSILAGAYGVYATVTDFREEKGGKKVLSRKGQLGIALLLFSIFLNVSADGVKDIKERKEAKAARAIQDKAVSDELTMLELTRDTVAKTASVLDETRRNADPFAQSDGFELDMEVLIPVDQELVKPYAERVRTPRPNDAGPVFVESNSRIAPDEHRATEEVMARLVSDGTVGMIVASFRKKGEKDRNHTLALQGDCRPENIKLIIPLHPLQDSRDFIKFVCHTHRVDWHDHDGGFRSYVDFDNSDISVSVFRKTVEYELHEVRIYSSRGREIVADKFHTCAGVKPEFVSCFAGKTFIR